MALSPRLPVINLLASSRIETRGSGCRLGGPSRVNPRHEDLFQRLQVVKTYYDEARLLEDAGKIEQAKDLYEVILIDLRHFRDTYDRLSALRKRLEKAATQGTAPSKPGKNS